MKPRAALTTSLVLEVSNIHKFSTIVSSNEELMEAVDSNIVILFQVLNNKVLVQIMIQLM